MMRETWQRLKSDPYGLSGLIVVSVFFLIASCVWSGLLGQGWYEVSGTRWEGISAEHWFGTNLIGQDILQRTLFGTATAFEVGLTVTVCSTLLGTVMGALSGWYNHSWLDEIILWLKGVLDAIPFYLFAAAVAFALQGSPWAMHVAMIVTFWTTTARIIRGEVIRIKQRGFIEAARAIGLPGLKTVFRHVLPNTFHLLLVQASIVFVAAINTEVILSFLGLGIQDGVSWGLMLAESSQEVLAGHFGNFLAAGTALFLLLMGFNLLADALQDALDSRRIVR
ncbi:MAG: ABC transporter permease [Xanthomonadales bacterium]|nr:ABC transporter permease [Gammaproteobacteria bacterium]MBT8072339.1 ABC transporter permease [Gammaproteobacteria bacterium]NNK03178.1 ABC transporter permease [Xanthomonadales bacterium]